MDVREVRRQKFLAEMRRHENMTAFSKATGVSYGYCSQIANETRNVGDSVARRMEAFLKKPRGWMDHIEPPNEVDGYADNQPLEVPSADVLERFRSASPKSQVKAIRTIVGAAAGDVDMDDLREAIHQVCIIKEEEEKEWTPSDMADYITRVYSWLRGGEAPKQARTRLLRLVKSA